MNKIAQAYKIAKKALRACYDDRGIFAGRHHYTDYWVRDSSFASFGALRLGDFKIVKKQLQLFLRFQKKDGQVPTRVGNKVIIPKLLGINMSKRLDPLYHHDKGFSPVADSNSLLLISAKRYFDTSGDLDFLRKNLHKLDNAHEWNISMSKDYLIEEDSYANFADSIKKRGKCLYSNVCYYKSVLDLASMYSALKQPQMAKKTKILASKIKSEIIRQFWNGEYLIDFIYKRKKYDYFITDGNMLAILFGIVSRKQSVKIFSYFDKLNLDKPVPCRTNYPTYPRSLIYPPLFLVNMHDYHNNSMAWLWLGCLVALAKYKINRKAALETLYEIANVIVKYKNVYEVYDKKGKPVQRFFYRSEHPFAWSSGLFIEAVHIIAKDIIKTT